jgi:hypothetical protein
MMSEKITADWLVIDFEWINVSKATQAVRPVNPPGLFSIQDPGSVKNIYPNSGHESYAVLLEMKRSLFLNVPPTIRS